MIPNKLHIIFFYRLIGGQCNRGRDEQGDMEEKYSMFLYEASCGIMFKLPFKGCVHINVPLYKMK